jgi:membrane-associated protease RseP (regulator of RpoE activity)
VKFVGVVAFVVALLASVMLHEAGHFATARRYGMKATQFFLGFGPTLWSRRRGETEFGIKAIPAGGFVKIVGMTPLEEVEPGDEDRAFYKQPAGRRAIVLVAGSTMHFILAIVLVYGAVLIGGVINNKAPVLSAPASCVVPTETVDCAKNAPPSPAKQAGIHKGDKVLAVGGAKVSTFEQFAHAVRSRPAGPVQLAIVRDGKPMTVTVDLVTAERTSLTDSKKTEKVSVMGIGQDLVVDHPGPVAAIGKSASSLGQLFTGTFKALGSLPGKLDTLFSPNRDATGAVGVVGISRISGDVAAAHEPLSLRIGSFLGLIAGLNFFVGIFNLMPLMPLDGGHLAVLGYEQGRDRIRRLRGYRGPLQRVDLNKLMPVAFAVVAVFVVLSVLILSADIVNPIKIPQ